MYIVEAQVKRVSEEDEPVGWRSVGEERGRRSGGAWKDGVAPTASLDGRRRSEKAKVLEKA
jgi:hypothetical protein